VAAACEDLTLPGGGVPTADLLPLGLQPAAALPASQAFWVANGQVTVRALRHGDQFNTLYAEVRFPAGSLASLNGAPLGPADSAQVTVTPTAGGYGLTLGPSGLAFAANAGPTVTFSYARYADVSVVQGSAYESVAAYTAALDVWEEATIGRWRRARASALLGGDQISAAIDAPSRVMVAAPR
jgi:hypothetical protein